VSKWARTRAVIKETGGLGGDSCGDLALEGNLPRRPFKESVLTTYRIIKQHYRTHFISRLHISSLHISSSYF